MSDKGISDYWLFVNRFRVFDIFLLYSIVGEKAKGFSKVSLFNNNLFEYLDDSGIYG